LLFALLVEEPVVSPAERMGGSWEPLATQVHGNKVFELEVKRKERERRSSKQMLSSLLFLRGIYDSGPEGSFLFPDSRTLEITV
jgi:hypothetical protein